MDGDRAEAAPADPALHTHFALQDRGARWRAQVWSFSPSLSAAG
jgi:hypothetical protein